MDDEMNDCGQREMAVIIVRDENPARRSVGSGSQGQGHLNLRCSQWEWSANREQQKA
jgi:hypothetical protein